MTQGWQVLCISWPGSKCGRGTCLGGTWKDSGELGTRLDNKGKVDSKNYSKCDLKQKFGRHFRVLFGAGFGIDFGESLFEESKIW